MRQGSMRQVLAAVLVAPAAFTSMALSCDGPHTTGAVGFLPEADGDRIGVVVAEHRDFDYGGLYEDYSGSGDGGRVLDGDIAVRWTSDGKRFSDAEIIPNDELDDLVPQALLDTWGPCIGGCPDDERWSVGSDPGPVAASRSYLLTRWEGACGGPIMGVSDTAVLPSTGETIVALGSEGVAVRDVDGSWKRHAVGRFEPTPVTIFEGLSVVARIGPELVLPLTVGVVGWWLAVLSIRTRRWRAKQAGAPYGAILGPLVIGAVGGVVVLMTLVTGAGFTYATVALGLGASAAAGTGAVLGTARLPKGYRMPLLKAMVMGVAAGALMPVIWVLGVPGSVAPWLLAATLLPLLFLLVPWRRGLKARPGGAADAGSDPADPAGGVDATTTGLDLAEPTGSRGPVRPVRSDPFDRTQEPPPPSPPPSPPSGPTG